MKKFNKRGFTLVELLAAMVILGMIMAIAIPNVMGILNNSRNKTYVDDAKRLASVAEYKFRSSQGIEKPTGFECVVMSLKYLDNSEFNDAPNGGSYDKERSYVVVRFDETINTYSSYINLVEKKSDGSYKGIYYKKLDNLNNSSAKELVTSGDESLFRSVNDFSEGGHITVSSQMICNNIKQIYKEK